MPALLVTQAGEGGDRVRRGRKRENQSRGGGRRRE
jgi:hypothetical protein